MKSRRLSTPIAALCIAAFSVAAYAQTDRLNAPTTDGSPTLQVTSDWLAQTLQVYGGTAENTDNLKYSNIQIDNNCTFSLTQTYTDDSEGTYYVDQFAVPMGAITSVVDNAPGTTGVQIVTGQIAAVRDHGIGAFVIPGKKPAPGAMLGPPGPDTYKNSLFLEMLNMPAVTPGAQLPDQSTTMVPRVITALQHAVALCAGSYTPPTQSPQPF
jgi:hypothetical protein